MNKVVCFCTFTHIHAILPTFSDVENKKESRITQTASVFLV